MLKYLSSACAALMLAGAATTASAQDRASAADIAERFVACDVAMFLDSRPDFSAQRIYAVRQTGGPPELLIGPDFLGPDRWHSEDLEIGYRRLQGRGEVSYDDLNAAYDRVGYPVLRQYSRRGARTYNVSSEVRDEARTCARFARDARLGRLGEG